MSRNRIFWASILIIGGVLVLLDNLGVLNVNVWGIIWPLAIILIGAQMFWSYIASRNAPPVEQLSIPLQGESSASIQLNHGAGRLSVGANPLPGMLLSGTFGGGVMHDVKRDGSGAAVNLRTSSGAMMAFPWSAGSPEGFQWNMDLNRDIPIALTLKGGASDSELDLTDLLVTDLRIETGASSTRVTLPAHAGYTRVNLESGAASISLRVPEGVAAQIHTSGGLSSIDVDRQRFPGGSDYFASPDFASAQNRVEINAETGVGSITVR